MQYRATKSSRAVVGQRNQKLLVGIRAPLYDIEKESHLEPFDKYSSEYR